MRHAASSLALCLIAACAAPQAPESGPSTESSLPAEQAFARLTASDDGRIMVEGANADLSASAWFVVRPVRWPEAFGDAPTVGTGRLLRSGDSLEAVPWALRQTRDLREFTVEPASAPQTLSGSKLLVRVRSIEGDRVRLAAGARDGVGSGDFYFLADPSLPSERVGEAVVAIVRVIEAAENESVARIEHASELVTVDHLAVFVQASLDRPADEATLAFAPIDGTSGSASRLPAIARAVPAALARYNISNISIVTLDQPLDPAAEDVHAEIRDHVPAQRFGTVFFGRVSDGVLLFNAASFGNPPHPANTVGILPGGLPLPLDGSDNAAIEELSEQLAPSFLATALALRGDHATAIYLLERALREPSLDPNVVFHLREHLALRYLALEQPTVGYSLMNRDIATARETGQVLPLLNALSIRAALHRDTGQHAGQLADIEEFLARAQGVLPERSLRSERLGLASAAADGGDFARAITLLQEVAQEANTDGDATLRSATLVRMALAHLGDDVPTAALLIAESVDTMGDAPAEERVAVCLIAAQIHAMARDPERARRMMSAAFDAMPDASSPALRASVFRTAANLLTELGSAQDAVHARRQASIALVESAQFLDAGRSMVQLAFQLFDLANDAGGAEGLPYFLEGRSNLHLASELMLRLGNSLEAARLYTYAGITESRIAPGPQADAFLDDAMRLARDSADFEAGYDVAWARFEMARSLGDWSAAERWRVEALRWAVAAEREGHPDLQTPISF